MTLAFLPVLAMAAAGAPADGAAPAVDYPSRDVLAAFATACSGVEDTAVNIASAQAAGWEQLPVDADTPVSTLVRAGLQALSDAADRQGQPMPQLIPGAEFRREVAGRQLYLAVSGMRDANISARGCRLYDFAAPHGISSAELNEWAVRQPNEVQDLPGGISTATFNPGLKPGHMEMQIFFVPPGAPPVAGITITGLSLVATAIEF